MDLEQAARTVVELHLGVRAGESVLVVTDEKRRRIGLAMFGAARALGAEAVLLEMVERETHGSELPAAVAAAMEVADVIVAPTSRSLSHTAPRQAATARGARCASMPLVTEEMMARALAADPNRLRALGRAYAEALTRARSARLTSPGGSDCTFVLTGRHGLPDDGDLTAPGAFGNLPAGEAFIAPVEGAAEGVIVFDGSLSPDGLTASPVVVRLAGGKVVEAAGGPAPGFLELPGRFGPLAWEVAELGIGTNDRAAVTGNVLEDEKVASTVHVAFGNNATIGGVTVVPSHHDGVVRDATLVLDGEVVLERGKLLLEG